MGRETYGQGIKVTRIFAILIGVCIVIGVIIYGYVAYIHEPKKAAKADAISFVHEFYNYSNSDDACMSVPIYTYSQTNNKSIEDSGDLNDACKSAHQTFKNNFADVSAVYVKSAKSKGNKFSGVTVTLEVVALDSSGIVLDELTNITIEFKDRKNPYYDYDYDETESSNGEDKHRMFPEYKYIEYGGKS